MNWRIELAQHAAERSTTEVHRELSRGLFGLATVAATAPFLGILGTLLGILGSFLGIDGEKTTIMAALAGRLSDAVVPTALGVAVAVVALAAYELFTAAVAAFDDEMRVAILGLPGMLSKSAMCYRAGNGDDQGSH